MKEIKIAKKKSITENENVYPFVKSNKLAKIKKLKLKWKTIKWMIENRKCIILLITKEIVGQMNYLEIFSVKFYILHLSDKITMVKQNGNMFLMHRTLKK